MVPSTVASRKTFCDAAETMSRTPGATRLPFKIRAAAWRSRSRPLTQVPMKATSILVPMSSSMSTVASGRGGLLICGRSASPSMVSVRTYEASGSGAIAAASKSYGSSSPSGWMSAALAPISMPRLAIVIRSSRLIGTIASPQISTAW